MKYLHELAKMCSLAAFAALIVVRFASSLTAITVGVAILYLLTVRSG